MLLVGCNCQGRVPTIAFPASNTYRQQRRGAAAAVRAAPQLQLTAGPANVYVCIHASAGRWRLLARGLPHWCHGSPPAEGMAGMGSCGTQPVAGTACYSRHGFCRMRSMAHSQRRTGEKQAAARSAARITAQRSTAGVCWPAHAVPSTLSASDACEWCRPVGTSLLAPKPCRGTHILLGIVVTHMPSPLVGLGTGHRSLRRCEHAPRWRCRTDDATHRFAGVYQVSTRCLPGAMPPGDDAAALRCHSHSPQHAAAPVRCQPCRPGLQRRRRSTAEHAARATSRRPPAEAARAFGTERAGAVLHAEARDAERVRKVVHA